MKNQIALLSLTLILASCTTMNKRECQSGAWQAAGYEDAVRGDKNTNFNLHADACAKHGVAADKTLYDRGYSEGLQTYCAPANAVQQGRMTNEYQGICPAETEQAFIRNYVKGLEIAKDDITQRYEEARDDLSNARTKRLLAQTSEDKLALDKRIAKLEDELTTVRNERSQVTTQIAQWLHRI